MSCAVGAGQGVDPTIPGNFGNTSGSFDAIFVATPTALFSCAAMTGWSRKTRTHQSGARTFQLFNGKLKTFGLNLREQSYSHSEPRGASW